MNTGKIIGITAGLAVLGVGGYFAYKHFSQDGEDLGPSNYEISSGGGGANSSTTNNNNRPSDSLAGENIEAPTTPDFLGMSPSEIKAYHNSLLTQDQLNKKQELNAASKKLKVSFDGSTYTHNTYSY